MLSALPVRSLFPPVAVHGDLHRWIRSRDPKALRRSAEQISCWLKEPREQTALRARMAEEGEHALSTFRLAWMRHHT